MSKNQLERILEIDRQVRSGNFPSKKTFTTLFEVSTKSVERDIYFMRYRMDAPIVYNYQKNGYFYTKESYFLPGHMLSEGEIFSLMMSKEIINGIGASPLKDQLSQSFNKLAQYLPEKVTTDQLSSLSKMTIITEGTVIIPDKTWNILIRSLRENNQISFKYKSSSANVYSKKIIHPYQLISFRGLWYVIGFNPKKGKIENYSIIRMKDLKIHSEEFTNPKDFNIEDYIDPEMGMYVCKKKYDVKIQFYNWVAPYIKERIWHRTQKITELEDGHLILEFTTNQITQTAQWVMSWGDGALVLEPKKLVDQVYRNVKNMAAQYEGVQNES